MISRTTTSSIIVSNAAEFPSLKGEIVGFRNAGKAFKTSLQILFCANSSSALPYPGAFIAPINSIAKFSICFASPHLPRLLIRDSTADTTPRSCPNPQLIRANRRTRLRNIHNRDPPNSGNFASVAPHENSTRACTLFFPQIPLRQLHRLRRNQLPLQIRNLLNRRILRNQKHPPRRRRRRLVKRQIAHRLHPRTLLANPSAPSNPRQKTILHINRNLLRPQQNHSISLRIQSEGFIRTARIVILIPARLKSATSLLQTPLRQS